jgi:nucleoside-diphosphate-sugar epimerase
LIKKVYFINENKLEINSANHLRTFCYIDDAINMIIKLIINEDSVNEVYNIGNSDNEISIMDVASKVVELANKKLELVPKPDINHGPKRRCPSTEKLDALVNYRHKIKIDEGISKCHDWYYNNVFKHNNESAI